jgi:hypothetical protein
MSEMKELNAKIEAYLQNPRDSLDLSRMNFRADGAKKVAEVLPEW